MQREGEIRVRARGRDRDGRQYKDRSTEALQTLFATFQLHEAHLTVQQSERRKLFTREATTTRHDEAGHGEQEKNELNHMNDFWRVI
jgi:hypothetical protein